MKKPTKRSGLCATAIATASASPGRLAISAALCTPCLSSSATQRAPSASPDSGTSQPSLVMVSRSAPSPAKKLGEKKCTCASLTTTDIVCDLHRPHPEQNHPGDDQAQR